jgi:enoyl-CoA hydratase/carnithine racemase
MTSRFRGKVVIQTAGTGIGAATARRFHAKGAAVVLSGRRSFSTIPKGNQINFMMREELFDAFERIAASTARAVVMSEEGGDFCAGGDIREWPGIPADALRPRIEVFADAVDRLERVPIPTIAAVQGARQGGGFELALGCDLIIASRSARFAFPEPRLGILKLQGGVVRLAARIGRSKAIELAFLCEPVSADRMAAWNVVHQVVADEDLCREAHAFATRLAAGLPGAYASAKLLLDVWSREGRGGARAARYSISMPLFDTSDVKTALRNAAEAVEIGKPPPKIALQRAPCRNDAAAYPNASRVSSGFLAIQHGPILQLLRPFAHP